MSKKRCTHLERLRTVTPSERGSEECLALGQHWLPLRVCRCCSRMGCCDESPGRNATKHFQATQHPIIEGYAPSAGWM